LGRICRRSFRKKKKAATMKPDSQPEKKVYRKKENEQEEGKRKGETKGTYLFLKPYWKLY